MKNILIVIVILLSFSLTACKFGSNHSKHDETSEEQSHSDDKGSGSDTNENNNNNSSGDDKGSGSDTNENNNNNSSGDDKGSGNNIDDNIDEDGSDNNTTPIEPPTVSLSVPNNQTVYKNVFSLTGKVAAGSASIVRIGLKNDEGNQVLSFNDNGYFTVDLSLKSGINNYIIEVLDEIGQSTALSFNVNYIPEFSVRDVTPNDKFISQQPQINIKVLVKSNDYTPSATLNNQVLNLTSFDDNKYVFEGIISLDSGENNFTLYVSAFGRSLEKKLSYFYQAKDIAGPAPEINILLPQAGARTRYSEIPFYAEVQSAVGGLNAHLNGVKLTPQLITANKYRLSTAVSLFEKDNQITLTVKDATGQVTTKSIDVIKATEAPTILLNNDWLPAPEINHLDQIKIDLSGHLQGEGVHSLSVNGTDIKLTNHSGRMAFSHIFSIPAREEVLVSLIAVDDVGNKQVKNFYLYSENSLEMDWLSPKFPVAWVTEKGTGYPFAVSLKGASSQETYTAILMPSQQAVSLQRVGSVLTGTIPTGLTKGKHTLIVKAYRNQKEIQNIEGEISVTAQADTPLTVLSVLPQNQAVNIEPDTPLQINFNRPVDPSDIVFSVKQTLHGLTYVNQDEPGIDFLHSKGYQLQEVNLSNVTVAGGLSFINAEQTVIFYPKKDLGYNANIDWEIKYQNKLISHQAFKTRRLPTFVEGGVIDTLNQTLAGISVEIEELGLRTQTNHDGSYAFGYNTPADKNIPEGEYHLVANADYKLTNLGSIRVPVSIVGGVLNKTDLIRVPNVDPNILPIPVERRPAALRLAQGKLNIELNGNELKFPNQQRHMHAQFITSSELSRNVMTGLAPFWFYQIQPFGIQPSGEVDLTIELPRYMGNYEYLLGGEQGESYVLMLGYNQNKNIIEAVGVGKITGTTLKTVRPIEYNTLDYLGYSPLFPKLQEAAEQYAQNQLSLTELVARSLAGSK